MKLENKTVLVTGAGGFIGSHLAESLVRLGCDVRALIHYNSAGSWGWLDNAPVELSEQMQVVAGDIRDPSFSRELVSGCDVVFHLAALIGIPYSYVAPAEYVATNVTGTLNMLTAARDAEVTRFLQTSTSEVYGTALSVPIDEEHRLHPQSPYAASKVGADQLALSFHRSFELPVSVVRPFNAYGPRQSTRAVLPTIITQIVDGADTIRLGATTPTRDFNFVTDLAGGFAAVASNESSIGEVINLGSDFEISIGAAAEVIADVMGRDIDISCDKERLRPEASEVERLWASNKKARELVGWTPAYGGNDGFRKGIEETVQWFSDPHNLARYKPGTYSI